MATHLYDDRTGTDSPARRITQFFLAARAATHPAANGKPPRSDSARVRFLRNEIGAGRMQPIENLLTIVADDLACGVPASEHLAWIDQLRAEVEVLAVETHRARREQPLPLLIVRESLAETAAQGKADSPQMQVTVDPFNLPALESFAAKAAKHRVTLGTLESAVRQQIAVIRCQSKRVYGAVRPSLEVMK